MSVMLWNRTSRNPIASLRSPGAAVGATASAIVKHLAIRHRFLAAAGTLLRVSALCTSPPATLRGRSVWFARVPPGQSTVSTKSANGLAGGATEHPRANEYDQRRGGTLSSP